MSHARPLVAAQQHETTTTSASGTWTFSTLGSALVAAYQARQALREAPEEVITRRVDREFVINRRRGA